MVTAACNVRFAPWNSSGSCSSSPVRATGQPVVATALADAAAGARSVAEAEAAERLVRCPGPCFELNVPMLDAAGRLVYVVDVLWRRLMLALEVDSHEFHFREIDWRATMARHNALSAAGLMVLHYAPVAMRGRDGPIRWLGRSGIEPRISAWTSAIQDR